jgi:hypothetical protein
MAAAGNVLWPPSATGHDPRCSFTRLRDRPRESESRIARNTDTPAPSLSVTTSRSTVGRAAQPRRTTTWGAHAILSARTQPRHTMRPSGSWDRLELRTADVRGTLGVEMCPSGERTLRDAGSLDASSQDRSVCWARSSEATPWLSAKRTPRAQVPPRPDAYWPARIALTRYARQREPPQGPAGGLGAQLAGPTARRRPPRVTSPRPRGVPSLGLPRTSLTARPTVGLAAAQHRLFRAGGRQSRSPSSPDCPAACVWRFAVRC